MSSRAKAVAIASRDRPWLDAYVNTLLGPFDMPDAKSLRDAVTKLAVAYPRSRLTSRWDDERRHWIGDRDVSAIVTERPWHDDQSIASALDEIGRDEALHPPLALVRYPKFLGMRISHSMGDGGILAVVLASVMHTAISGEVPIWPPQPAGRFPLVRAAVRTFGGNPVAIRTAFADRFLPEGDFGAVEERPWSPSRRTLVTSFSSDLRGEMTSWAKGSAPGASIFALLTSATLRALARVGVAVSPNVNILMDLRRYLGKGWIDGNFIANVPLRVGAATPPQQIAATMKATMLSGRPLANQMLSSLRSLRPTPPVATSYRPKLAAQVAFSNIGRYPGIDDLPFASGSPVYTGGVEPAGPQGLTFLFTHTGVNTIISASFHDNVVDADSVEQVLKLVAADPVTLVAGALGET